ncbi:uncharacterized protein LOC122501030 isoform X3 [Leptopilina heterotoma]|uniref:uncharacterized protein LOC122501030 isoform X3 n=1 Tax=Leptopilina heterotoma TaxID=63436 RepID=UPI001CA80698|nr:uncharacterized protein LOC122501030 isoform X3 [Leptopilina heterotoma]
MRRTIVIWILKIMLLSIASLVSSYTYNKTTKIPITYTVSKVIDLTKPITNESQTSKLNRRTSKQSINTPTDISKRQDSPSFGGSLSTFDEPSGGIYADSFSGFRDSRPINKDEFDIDDIDIKSTSFGIEDSGIKNNPSFGIVSPKIKESSSFDVDTPTFSLDSENFNDDTAFNIGSTSFEEEEETQNKEEEEEDTQYNIDPSNFESDEPTTKKPSSFEPDFSNAKRSPPYSSGRNKEYRDFSNVYGPQASNSRAKSYDSPSKENYKYPKNQDNSNSKDLSSNGPIYSDSNVEYVGSSATPINYVTTPHDRFDSPFVDGGSQFTSSDQTFKGFGQSSFQNSLFDQGPFAQNSFQNLNSNSFRTLNPPTQNAVENTQHVGLQNSQQIFSPTHQTEINLPPSSQSYESLSTSLPTHNTQFSGFIEGQESQPVLFNTDNGFNFQAPNFGIPFDFGTESRNQPFLTLQDLQQQRQILPVQTSSSTPQFPQYKGASIPAHSRSDFVHPSGAYQFLTNQPQLHFNPNNGPVDRMHVQTGHNPFERIRTDVEVIDKKKPAPPQHDGKDDEESQESVEENDDLDDGYNSAGQEYGSSEENENSKAQINSDEDSRESFSLDEPEFKHMPPMGKFVFQPFDDKISMFDKFVNHNRPENRYSVESNSSEDDDYTSKQYASINSPSSEYDESDDEEESKKFEKQIDDDVSFSSDKGLPNIKNYDSQFQQKFNLPYLNEGLKTKFAQDRSSVPDILKYNKRKNSPKSDKNIKGAVKGGSKIPISRNNEEEESKLNFQIYDKSFGHKIPKNSDSLSRFKKDNSHQQIPLKKETKPLAITEKSFRPSQTLNNVAFVTEDDYNFFSPQRIKLELNKQFS